MVPSKIHFSHGSTEQSGILQLHRFPNTHFQLLLLSWVSSWPGLLSVKNNIFIFIQCVNVCSNTLQTARTILSGLTGKNFYLTADHLAELFDTDDWKTVKPRRIHAASSSYRPEVSFLMFPGCSVRSRCILVSRVSPCSV